MPVLWTTSRLAAMGRLLFRMVPEQHDAVCQHWRFDHWCPNQSCLLGGRVRVRKASLRSGLWTLDATPHAVVAVSEVRGSMNGLVQDEHAYTTYLHHSSLKLDQIIVQAATHHSTVPAQESTWDVIVPLRQQRESGLLMMTCPYRSIIPRRRCCGKWVVCQLALALAQEPLLHINPGRSSRQLLFSPLEHRNLTRLFPPTGSGMS
ncbi:hypothetical protein CMEL01_05628 [Colletotrichum melonis]|uniref:Uncharacterized protein n=1 Tax=Colletotrichum melonis TaxID=1209925 RepID=A0AAI9UBL2_9PEZI|nr:hypothetical protein CMEL01_05628 [Colletotrichum melonis]